jgi:predicted ferric reductase
MKTLKYTFWGSLVVLSALWWQADLTDWSSLHGLFAWRNVLNQYTGILGIGVMSLAMLLAVRPVFLERQLGGLDKMYRLHKWLGIAGLVLSISHWLIAKGRNGWWRSVGWSAGPRASDHSCRTARCKSSSWNSAAWPKALANGPSTSPPCSWCWP